MDRVLDAVHLAVVWHVLYHYVVVNFANPLALLEPAWYAFPFQTVVLILIQQLNNTRSVAVCSNYTWTA